MSGNLNGDPNAQPLPGAANEEEGVVLEPGAILPDPVAIPEDVHPIVPNENVDLNVFHAYANPIDDWTLVPIQMILQQLEGQQSLTPLGRSQLQQASSMLMTYLADPINATQEKTLQAQLLLQMVNKLDAQAQSVVNLSPIASRTSLPDYVAQTDVESYLKRARLPDFSKLMKFDSKDILEYPMYRANMRQLVMSTDAYTNQQKFSAFCHTLDKEARSFLTSVDPEEPDLEKVLRLLDEQYLRGTTVEDALCNVIRSAHPLTQASTLQEWHQFRAMVDSMNSRAKAGNLTSTAEHHFHMELIGKLPFHDQNLARMKGTDLQSLVIVVEKCIRRTRLIGEQATRTRESKAPLHSPRRDSRYHPYVKRSYPPEGRFTRIYTTKETCFFCNGTHSMDNCPKALSLKRQKVRDARLCWMCLDDFKPGHSCGKLCSNCRGPHHASMCPRKSPHNRDQGQWPPRRSTSTAADIGPPKGGSA